MAGCGQLRSNPREYLVVLCPHVGIKDLSSETQFRHRTSKLWMETYMAPLLRLEILDFRNLILSRVVVHPVDLVNFNFYV